MPWDWCIIIKGANQQLLNNYGIFSYIVITILFVCFLSQFFSILSSFCVLNIEKTLKGQAQSRVGAWLPTGRGCASMRCEATAQQLLQSCQEDKKSASQVPRRRKAGFGDLCTPHPTSGMCWCFVTSTSTSSALSDL